MAAIAFFEQEVKSNLKNRKRLKEFIIGLFKKEKTEFINMSVIFCTDEYLLKMNQQILQHDFFTDIISFDLSNNQNGSESELYISIDRVRENAVLYKTTYEKELIRVIFHGCLHLCGYNDKDNLAQSQMRKMEDKYLSQYF